MGMKYFYSGKKGRRRTALDTSGSRPLILLFAVLAFLPWGCSSLQVSRPDPGSSAYFASRSFGSGTNRQLERPAGIVSDDKENIYVTDMVRKKIFVYSMGGKLIKTIGLPGKGSGKFDLPAGIIINEGYLYAVDAGNGVCQKISIDGKSAAVIKTGRDSQAGQDTELSEPFGITLFEGKLIITGRDSSACAYGGKLFVAWKDGVRVYDPGFNLLYSFGEWGPGKGQFRFPMGICADEFGYLYIADTLNNRVLKYTSDGDLVRQIGLPGTRKGELSLPHGLFVNNYGELFVCDYGNGRVQKFSPFFEPALTAGSMNNPEYAFHKALILSSFEEYYAAISLLQQIRVNTDDPHLLVLAFLKEAACWDKIGNIDNAVKLSFEAKDAAAGDIDKVRALSYLAGYCEKADMPGDAWKYYNEIAADFPGHYSNGMFYRVFFRSPAEKAEGLKAGRK